MPWPEHPGADRHREATGRRSSSRQKSAGATPPPAWSVCCTTPEPRPRARDIPFRAAVPSCANRQHSCLTGSQPHGR